MNAEDKELLTLVLEEIMTSEMDIEEILERLHDHGFVITVVKKESEE